MALITLTSTKGAPGTTTSALALMFAWHRPVLLVEADAAGASSILSGYLRGGTDHTRGLLELSLVQRTRSLAEEDLWRQVLELAPTRYLLPGLGDPAQAAGMTATWPALAGHLNALEHAGVDVLVDAGRLGTAYFPTPLLRASDAVLVVSGTRLPDVYALSRRAPALVGEMAAAGRSDVVQILLVGEGRPYVAREIRDQLSLPVLGSLAWDPQHAETYSVGVTRARRFESSPLARSAEAVAGKLVDTVQRRRERLTQRPLPKALTSLPAPAPAEVTSPVGLPHPTDPRRRESPDA